MENQKIKHVRLYEKVITSIEKQFQEGKLNLGDKLAPERELAVLFGVSRGTLRDAFRVLESHGVIETKPGGGRYLRKNLKEEALKGESIIEDLKNVAILDLLEAREILEVGLMELVCKRVNEEDVNRIEKLINTSKRNELEEKDIDYYFHHALAEASKNIVVIKYINLNLELINQTRKKNFSNKSNFNEAQKEHIDILEAIKSRDSSLAKEKMRLHFSNIRKRLNIN
ncbi:FadR/GntR family transcriptional regulator [Virgibacillus sp. C22-A2]|uniref:FadR/GntR family transcriptional regulator n=1 Tax=Virgibacillus tibetensis TaxID=3042313 RepID=A0ABU6KDI5_9BACI|nr:FadR/GntR family transcriptional regulator [Virgibacillus sp. C22-A2]